MVIHFTEKLRKKLHIPELTQVPVPAGNHLRWYANLFTAQQVQYILTTNAASLLSVVVCVQDLSEDNNYFRHFLSQLRDHLEDIELQLIYERVIEPGTDQITLAKTADPSVLASMTNMINLCKRKLRDKDLSPWQLTEDLNGTPFKSLGFRFPREVFAQMPLDEV